MENLTGTQALDKIWDLIKDIKIAHLATYDPQGRIFHARPMMSQQAQFDGTLWFLTGLDSRKVDEIKAHPDALLTYSEPKDQKYVSMSGKAYIEHDQAKIDELWSEMAKTWFPQGKDDPNIALVRFQADEAEFWEAPSGLLLYGYGYLKAIFTGEPPQLGQTGKVEFADKTLHETRDEKIEIS
jgi:general stress protein 26